MVLLVCLVQLLQQFVDYLHDIGGQQVAKPSQTVRDFFLLIHFSVSVNFLLLNTYDIRREAQKRKETEDVGGLFGVTTYLLRPATAM